MKRIWRSLYLHSSPSCNGRHVMDSEQQQSPSGWEEIAGLSLEERMMLDELAHGLVTPRSLEWICEMIRAEQLGKQKK